MAAKRIYIADDDDNIREAIRVFLENDGYEVTGFAEGESLLLAEQDACENRLTGKTILLLEDQPMNMLIAQRLLEKQGGKSGHWQAA